MLNNIYLSYAALRTPLGNTLESNWYSLNGGKSGIRMHANCGVHNEDLYLSLLQREVDINPYDELLQRGLEDILANHPTVDFQSERTLFIISSTKGNIQDLKQEAFASTRRLIREITKSPNPVVILSNACISGVSAINVAANYVRAKQMDHVIVIGIDIVWDFVKFGFQSLFAMSDQPVQPFDINRKGVNLGEAFAAVLISNCESSHSSVRYIAGSNSNDANHISGPSRTGEGLVRTVKQSLDRGNVAAHEIDFISGHGTGTLFNDEMESIAFERMDLQEKPIHSLKGYYGHTLGAAGVLETIIAIKMMQEQQTIASLGFEHDGTSKKLAICTENKPLNIQKVLKTASGFGGGNASLIFERL